MEQAKVCGMFLALAICVLTASPRTSWTWSVANGIGRDEVPFIESCSRFDEGQKTVKHEADGTP
ncbi:uncharacterized protein LOC142576363 isoform X4 [Dermacentor variabilis]|uniref:uncharacterized protein LOC142576363 isoform X4 n=1 Tax=Dermacentor variabilis TaxID=34621 RepID=UPI003F5B7BAD